MEVGDIIGVSIGIFFIGFFVFGILFYGVKRYKDSKKEKFEKRDN